VYPEAIHLAFCRLVCILCGVHDYLLHNGNGIFGIELAGDGGRKPNLWECEDIDRIMTVLRKLESYLPENPGEGSNTRKGLGPHPLEAKTLMQHDGHGATRDYAIVRGDGWWQCIIGIKDYVDMIAHENAEVTFIDVIDGTSHTVTLSKGQTHRLEPNSRDEYGNGAWLAVGRFI
jgi:hypothetical protein